MKDIIKEPIVTRVRRLLKRRPDEPTGSDALSRWQAREVRAAVIAHSDRLGQRLDRGILVATEAVHRDDLDPVAEGWSRAASQPFIAAAERPGTMSSNRARP